MCGRYAASAEMEEVVAALQVELDRTAEPSRSVLKNPQQPPPGTPDWNVAPTKQARVVLTRAVREEDGTKGEPARQLRLMTWGLVPSWSKDPSVGIRMINARAETALEKSSYAKAATSRRCLVPADGWYEWQRSPVALDAKGKPRKQPFYIHRGDDAPLALAGLYEFWRDPGVADPDDPAAWLTTFAVVTTAADPGMDRIHDRQPLVLDPDVWDDWLDPHLTDPVHVQEMLDISLPGRLAAHPVSTAVNASAGNGPGLVEPVPTAQLVGVVDPETGEVIGG